MPPQRGRPQAASSAEVVSLFSAMQTGQLDVRFVPRDAWQGWLQITNKTNQPLSVQLPTAFGATPVLAQVAPGNPNSGSRSNSSNASQSLSVLSPLTSSNSQQQNAAMNRQAGPMWNVTDQGGTADTPSVRVAPKKPLVWKVRSFCLDLGKPTPHAWMPYVIKPLENVSSHPEVVELSRMAATGAISYRVAQAALWHVNNGAEWKHLVAPPFMWPRRGPVRFTPAEIQTARMAVDQAAKTVQNRKSGSPPASAGAQ